MKIVLQRVTRASVTVEGQITGQIQRGFLLLVGVGQGDTLAQAKILAEKVLGLRVFEDEAGKMNRALAEVGGGLLVVSQFTLFGDTSKGRRPSFGGAMEPVAAKALFDEFCGLLRGLGAPVETGVFGAKMAVELCNDGPVTLLLEAKPEP